LATRTQQGLLIFDEERRVRLIRDGIPFSRELTNAAWAVLGSAVKHDDASFTLAAVASSGIVSPLVTENSASPSGEGQFVVQLRLIDMVTGVLPFPIRLEYFSNGALQNFEQLTFTRIGSFLPVAVVGTNVSTFFPQVRMVTGDAAKSATLEFQQLEYRQLTI
jgi:hypothetical protein